MRRTQQFGTRIGRAMLGAMFVKLGSDAAREPGPRVGTAERAGVPEPETLVRVNGAAMALGGAALIVDRLPRAAAVGLIASLVPTTVVGHPFWKLDGPERTANAVQVSKNVGLVGALLLVAAGPGRDPIERRSADAA